MNAAPASVAFRALGTTALLLVSEPAALVEAQLALERELAEVDLACSRFRADSQLLQLNNRAGEPVRVGELLFEAVSAALRVAAATEGIVDPTVGRALRLAGYDRDFELVRRRDGGAFRAVIAPVLGWKSIRLDRARRAIRVPHGVELDLGATAKALAADRAAEAAHAATGAGVLVGLGGDIAVAGEAPAGGWPVLIADDHGADLSSPGAVVSIASGGLATSSTTTRRWRSGEAELHHILDPRTGRSAETPWRTVSVAAASCVDANAASTAAIVLGDDAPAWLERRRLPARLAREDGARVRVAGWPEEEALA
jgi:thiamine biosynthesis lipoprotein